MLVKIFSHGQGAGGGLDYLLSGINSRGERRDPPAELVRGQPYLMRQVLGLIKFKRRYTAGVLSFAEPDLPWSTQTMLMDRFERDALFPGLSPARYLSVWVAHRDTGRLELHWTIANVDLWTGKRLQPYYDPVDRARIDLWQEVINLEFGLASPKEAARQRTWSIPGEVPPDRLEEYQRWDAEIQSLIPVRLIEDRDGVVEYLDGCAYPVVGWRKQYLLLEEPGPVFRKLHGYVYSSAFSPGRSAPAPRLVIATDPIERAHQLETLRPRLAHEMTKRAAYLQKRHPVPVHMAKAVTPDSPEDLTTDITAWLRRFLDLGFEAFESPRVLKRKPKNDNPKTQYLTERSNDRNRNVTLQDLESFRNRYAGARSAVSAAFAAIECAARRFSTTTRGLGTENSALDTASQRFECAARAFDAWVRSQPTVCPTELAEAENNDPIPYADQDNSWEEGPGASDTILESDSEPDLGM